MFVKRGRLGRRGISPLIATVLLIAFAVAIGTILVTIFKDKLVPRSGDCSQVDIEIQNINNEPLFCYDTLDQKIKLMIRNTGSVDVDSLKIIISAADFTTEDVPIKDSYLKSGNILTTTVDYVKSGQFKAEIVPIINYGGEDRVCLDKTVSVNNLTACNK